MSGKLKVSDMLARAFAAEGVEHLFTLMGDANMYWSTAMAELPNMKVWHARHEHCAVAMADGYARATGKVGVASTTCGPGFTQIMTALTIAARGNVPIVVFAGDSPIGASWYLQQIDMAPLALACGAHYVGVKHIDRLLDNVREAFLVAQSEQRPVVLSVPMDLQKQAWPHMTDYTPSSDLLPAAQRPVPDPAIVDRVVDMIAEAEKPILIAGRGAILSGAALLLLSLAMVTVTLASTGDNPTPPDGALLVPFLAPAVLALLGLGLWGRAARIFTRAYGARKLGGLPLALIAGGLAFAAFEISKLAARF